MTYGLCLKIIEKGLFKASDLINKFDVFLLGNRITEEEYKDLAAKITEQNKE